MLLFVYFQEVSNTASGNIQQKFFEVKLLYEFREGKIWKVYSSKRIIVEHPIFVENKENKLDCCSKTCSHISGISTYQNVFIDYH